MVVDVGVGRFAVVAEKKKVHGGGRRKDAMVAGVEVGGVPMMGEKGERKRRDGFCSTTSTSGSASALEPCPRLTVLGSSGSILSLKSISQYLLKMSLTLIKKVVEMKMVLEV
ncbi:uncharacterized protein G2W53_001611 [Senna tora]|uniref:Uncharacterized protein n=1 Tax=Senna tora TaxID=362788 RepID=A0A835CIQ1_9FABA|nr:uncharacterized protein G2W53_001611 [Senna tora]